MTSDDGSPRRRAGGTGERTSGPGLSQPGSSSAGQSRQSAPGSLAGDPFLAEIAPFLPLEDAEEGLADDDGEGLAAPALSAAIEGLLAAAAERSRAVPDGTRETAAEDILLPPSLVAELEAAMVSDEERRERGAPTRSLLPSSDRPATEPPPTVAGPTALLEAGVGHVPTRGRREDEASEEPGVQVPESFGRSAPSTVHDPRPHLERQGFPPSEGLRRSDGPPARLDSRRTDAHALVDAGGPRRAPVADAGPLDRPPAMPPVGDALTILGRAIRDRETGALELASEDGTRVRHVVLKDGDLVTVVSAVEGESLLQMLVDRGDLPPELARERAARLPRGGRHAAAALIAQGFLEQDELWPVLRAHGEWCLGRALREGSVVARLATVLPDKLAAEPAVFGGASGVEIFIDAVRRVLAPEEALERLGGGDAVVAEGAKRSLLHEAGLEAAEHDAMGDTRGRSVDALTHDKPDRGPLIAALAALGILEVRGEGRSGPPKRMAPGAGLDATAVRHRIAARLALVRDADYFTLLGVDATVTGYELRRAYLDLRRSFEPSRILTPETMDLADDVAEILDVLLEAYELLRDEARRARYRRALGDVS